MKWFSYILVAFLLFTVSCQKESEQINLEKINLPVDEPVYDILFLDENIGFACGGKIWTYGFVLKTTDGGSSWDIIHESDNLLFSLALKSEQEVMTAGFSGRLWYTLDGGTSWVKKDFGPDYMPLNAISWLNNERVVFSMGFKYFVGGQGFYNTVSGQFTGHNLDIAMQDIYAFSDDEIIYCGYGKIIKSYDSGLSFENKVSASGFFKALDFEDKKGLVVAYNGLIQYSNNKGETWEKVEKIGNTFSQNKKLEDVAVKNNIGIICGQDGVLYKTNLGSNEIIILENNYTEKDFYSVALLANGTALIGSEGAIFKFNY